MAINNTLNSIDRNLSNAYDALAETEAVMPEVKNLENLAKALDDLANSW